MSGCDMIHRQQSQSDKLLIFCLVGYPDFGNIIPSTENRLEDTVTASVFKNGGPTIQTNEQPLWKEPDMNSNQR
jgi:hypothetical protein